MREMINYIMEANAALLLFLVFYQLFLKQETSFRFLRIFMLSAIVISLILPLVHLNTDGQQTNIPSISQVVPEYWFPEIVIGNEAGTSTAPVVNKAYDVWQFAGWVYIAGVAIFSVWLIMQLGYVWIMLWNAITYRVDRLRIIESPEDKPTFSFFNLIYIGRADELSPVEKEQIIRHERVHAKQWHSLDILLTTILGIIFWFNPLIKYYKKIFIQLHEFEADARAVENSDVDAYCSLLARVALQAHFPIASHFNESLTVKRIEMMRTIKKKLKPWKVAAVASAFSLCFFVIACQDQVLDEVANSTITQTGDYPAEAKADMEKYMIKNPDAKLTYMEGDPLEIEKFTTTEQVKPRVVGIYDVDKGGVEKKGVLLSDVVQHAEALQTEDKVFMVVEKMPEFPGGYDAMINFIGQNLNYPEASRGKSGTVYISMVIGENGKVSNAAVLRGVDRLLDAEALRVIRMLPAWIPGEQNGKKVNVRFNIPIRFNADCDTCNMLEKMTNSNYKMKVDYTVDQIDNTMIIRGHVGNASENGKKLAGVNVIVAGTTSGTTTDANGNFVIKMEKQKGKLNLSFVGFDPEEIDF